MARYDEILIQGIKIKSDGLLTAHLSLIRSNVMIHKYAQ